MAEERNRLERRIVVALYLVALTLTLRTFVDPDLPGHLLYGLDHLRAGHLPTHDPYGFTAPDRPWINHEWAFEAAMALAWRALAAPGLVLLQLLAWGGACALVLRLIRRATPDLFPGAVFYLLFLQLIAPSVSIRPQLATFLCFAVLLTLLEAARAGRTWAMAVAPLLFVPWVNLHGGFLAGLGVLGLYNAGLVLDAVAGRRPPGDLPEPHPQPKRLAVLACLAVPLAAAATVVNPYGLDLHRFLARSLGVPRPWISEWRSMQLDQAGAIFAALAALTALAMAHRLRTRRAQLPSPHLLVLAVTGVLAVRHVRHVPFFAMSAAAFAPGAFAALWRARFPKPDDAPDLRPRAARALGVAAVLGGVLTLGFRLTAGHGAGLVLEEDHPVSPFPVEAFDYAERHELSGHALVFFDWAQLAIWEIHPRGGEVYFDGRFRTVYPAEIEADYFAFLTGSDDWRAPFRAHRIDWVLLRTRSKPAHLLAADPAWRLAFEDEVAVLFVPAHTDHPPYERGDMTPLSAPFE